MFLGSLPHEMQSVIKEHVQCWTCSDVYVGCSGKFTIERMLDGVGQWNLHGNDVQLYSSVIGHHLAGTPFRLDVRQEWQSDFGWLKSYMGTAEDKVATVMLASNMLVGLNKENPYYERVRGAYIAEWPDLHAKTKTRVSGITLRLADFYCGDVVDYFSAAPTDQGVVSFPPFYVGGYETMFKAIESVFDWDEPSYQLFDEERMQIVIDTMRQKKFWLFGNNLRRPDLEPYLRAIIKTTNRGVAMYIYSSGGESRAVVPRQLVEPLLVPRLSPGDAIGESMTLARLDARQFSAVRAQYLNASISPSSPLLPIGVLVDGRLIGCFGFNRPQYGSDPGAYMLSDFAVSPTDYPRLSKLVLYAALSSEAKILAERAIGSRVRVIDTTAFSMHPVSMKYRGLFDVIKRTAISGEHHRWQLQYRSDAGRWSLADGLSEWKKKHGGRRSANTPDQN